MPKLLVRKCCRVEHRSRLGGVLYGGPSNSASSPPEDAIIVFWFVYSNTKRFGERFEEET
jgi:hypothetical protein